MSLESELLVWLNENLPTDSRLTVGLGDDAAVLRAYSQVETVVTTDMLTDGVDFLLSDCDPRLVGHKALGVNLSDLAAMAARPVTSFVSLALPRDGCGRLSPLQLAIHLYEGMLPLAKRFKMTIAGGDTNSWDGPLAISITALGETTSHGPLTRSSAQVGDHLLVTGHLGGSLLGKHLHVEPRIDEALLLHSRYKLHAGIDISDGLALDDKFCERIEKEWTVPKLLSFVRSADRSLQDRAENTLESASTYLAAASISTQNPS